MNPFSSTFQLLLEEKQLKIVDVEHFTGIDRSVLYKLLNGTKEPTDAEMVEQIADCLCLTLQQREQFLETYYLTKRGPMDYYGRKEIVAFFQEVNLQRDYEASPFLPFAAISLDPGQKIVLNGAQNVDLAIEYFIYSMSQSSSCGTVEINEELVNDVTLSVIKKITAMAPELKIRHMVLLDSEVEHTAEKEHILYNVQVLRKVIATTIKASNYTVLYRYGNIMSKKHLARYLPNYVLAGEYVLQFSNDHRFGIVSRDQELRELYGKLFQEHEKDAAPLVYANGDMDSMFSSFPGEDTLQDIVGHERAWHVLPGISGVQFNRGESSHSSEDLFGSSPVQNLFKSTPGGNHTGRSDMLAATSIDFFVQEGYLADFPQTRTKPLSINDRIAILQRLLVQVRHLNLKLVDFKEYHNPSNIDTVVTRSGVYLTVYVEPGKTAMAAVREPSIVRTFHLFLETLEEESSYSVEQTVSYLSWKIRELQDKQAG